MQMIDLLEKKERAIYQLYLRLQDSDRPLTLKELSQELDLSRSTLARYIQVFCEEAEEEQLGIAFQVEGDYLLMERSPILTKQIFWPFYAGRVSNIRFCFPYLTRRSFPFKAFPRPCSSVRLLSIGSFLPSISPCRKIRSAFGTDASRAVNCRFAISISNFFGKP